MCTRHSVHVVLALTVLGFCEGRPGAQQSTSDQPAFRSGVELVTVEVGAVDKDGRPVRGLTPEDFKVTVAGQPRRIVTAEYVEVGSPADPGPKDDVV
ncbi:MAG: hypothetical protein ACM36C_17695, partial [Acidobacteriota bacterium]